MQDYQQAKTVLKEVLEQGSADQKQAAQSVLQSIPGEK